LLDEKKIKYVPHPLVICKLCDTVLLLFLLALRGYSLFALFVFSGG